MLLMIRSNPTNAAQNLSEPGRCGANYLFVSARRNKAIFSSSLTAIAARHPGQIRGKFKRFAWSALV